MENTRWGPCLWKSIHYIAAFYPENPTLPQRKQYEKFYNDLHYVIPCHKCAENYKVHLQELPITNYLVSRDILFAWTVDLHNIVNKALNKPTWTLDEARAFYIEGQTGKGESQGSNNILFALLGTLLIIPCGYLLYAIQKSRKSSHI